MSWLVSTWSSVDGIVSPLAPQPFRGDAAVTCRRRLLRGATRLIDQNGDGSCPNQCFSGSDRISRFKVRVKDSNGRYDRYDLEDVLSHTHRIDPINVDHRLPTVDGDREQDPVVDGLDAHDGPFHRLCHLLNDGDEQFKVLSIVGVGGIGKTTLAKQLWRKHKPGGYFHCRAFVRTAKKPDMRRILRSILAQVRPHQPPDANEVQELIHDLREHLQDKRRSNKKEHESIEPRKKQSSSKMQIVIKTSGIRDRSKAVKMRSIVSKFKGVNEIAMDNEKETTTLVCNNVDPVDLVEAIRKRVSPTAHVLSVGPYPPMKPESNPHNPPPPQCYPYSFQPAPVYESDKDACIIM